MSTLYPEKPCGVRRFIRHRKRFLFTLLTAFILSLSGIVLAVHLDENFELEGDVFDDWMGIIMPGDDWDQIYCDMFPADSYCLSQSPAPSNAGISQFVHDDVVIPDNIFTGGMTKDDELIIDWRHTTGTVPDKDDLLHAFAAAYQVGSERYLYFGADRFTTNGDSEIGFWFFQNAINDEPCEDQSCMWSGEHEDGDIFVLSDFTNGGTVSTIKVYKWQFDCVNTAPIPADCVASANNLLEVDLQGIPADCRDPDAIEADLACATVNADDNTQVPPWDYLSKQGLPSYATGAFYEGGVNLSTLGLVLGCNATFLAETRSSQSVDAVLKDYALGSFAACSIEIIKSGPPQSKVGDQVTYEYTINNTNITALYLVSVVDDVVGDITAAASAAGCDILEGENPTDSDTCTFTVDWTVVAGDPTSDFTLSNVVVATYNDLETLDGTDVMADDSAVIDLFQPSIDVVKTGDPMSKVGDVVNYTFTLSNDSVAGDGGTPPPELNCTATDSLMGVIFGPAVLPPGDTVINDTYTVQAGDPNPLINTVTLSCTLPGTFTNVIDDAVDTHSVELFTPEFSITKTGDELSKVGDDVMYTFTLSNDSSANTPALTCTATDDRLGVVWGPAVLPLGDTVVNMPYTIMAADPDPLDNTVTMACTLPTDFTNTLDDVSASWSINLFQPAFDIIKFGDGLSKVGDDVNYTFELINSSSGDTPEMTCTAVDDLLGTIFGPAILLPGTSLVNQTYTVQAGDPNPLVNTVTLSCGLDDRFTNDLADATDSHSVDLFTPAFDIIKTGDDLSKVGDDVLYTYTMSNTSTANTPDLTCTATDDVFGVVWGPDVLPLGDTVVNLPYTIQALDPDPLVNNVILSCTLPPGFTNTLDDATDSHSIELFQPGFTIDKTGDALSKVGDDVTYTFTLTNSSSADTPDLTCTATDSHLGVVFGPAVLAAGVTQFDWPYTIQAGDSDPLFNEVTLSCALDDRFTNDLADEMANHTIELFQPAFSIAKGGDELSKVGDDVLYTITMSNLSSVDTPVLTCTAIDNLLGTVFGPGPIASGEIITANVPYTILATDPDPLLNTVVMSCELDDRFTNDLDDVSASHSVNLFQPAFSVTKTGDDLSKVGDDVNYTITFSNTSSADTPDLTCGADDSLLGQLYGGILPPGDTVITPVYTVQAGDPDPLVNTITLSCELDDRFTNDLADASDSHSVNLFQPGFDIVKTGDELSKVGDDVMYTFTLSNTSSADSPALTCALNDDHLGPIFGPAPVLPGEVIVIPWPYTIQAGDSDPLVNTVTLSCELDDRFTNDLGDASDSHSINLFQPEFAIVKDGDAFTKVGDDVDYLFTLSNTSSADTPDLTCTASDSLLGTVYGPALLPIGDTSVPWTYTVLASDPDPLVNVVTLSCTLPDEFSNVLPESNDNHTVDLLQPDFTVFKDCLTDEIPVGASANFRIDIENIGNAALLIDVSDPLLSINDIDVDLNLGSGCIFDSNPVDGCLRYEAGVVATEPGTIDNLVTVSADMNVPGATFTNVIEPETASDFCTVIPGGATRTIGFWRTHGSDGTEFDPPVDFGYTCHIFEDHIGAPIDAGWTTLANCEQVFGAFWANNTRESDGDRRNKTCQAKVMLTRQWLGSVLNVALDNGSPIPIDSVTGLDLITAAYNEMAGPMNRKEMIRLMRLLTDYNESGDDTAIIDNDGTIFPHADPIGTKAVMDLTAVDCQ